MGHAAGLALLCEPGPHPAVHRHHLLLRPGGLLHGGGRVCAHRQHLGAHVHGGGHIQGDCDRWGGRRPWPCLLGECCMCSSGWMVAHSRTGTLRWCALAWQTTVAPPAACTRSVREGCRPAAGALLQRCMPSPAPRQRPIAPAPLRAALPMQSRPRSFSWGRTSRGSTGWACWCSSLGWCSSTG